MNDQRKQNPWLVLFTAWATFFLFAVVAVPIPGVNEPHYLCKAKHFWQPDWCANDFFLESPNAHTVFYATVGILTKFLPLAASAFIGRLFSTLVLAWGWTYCLSKLFFKTWASVWCAWLFLAITACGNFSGEWLVGGVEGKVFSYGFLLVALGDAFRDRWRFAAVWAGIAVSFHPVVGIWGLFAFFASRITKFRFHRIDVESSVILFVVALPGLIPVVRILTDQVSEDTRYQATYLQVYFRLAHHLDPMIFSNRAYLGYMALMTIWIGSLFWGGRTLIKQRFDQIVFWAIIFAICGIILGYGPRPPVLMPYFAFRMNLLKFYPFRLADVLLPIAVAIGLISVLERTLLNTTRRVRQQKPLHCQSGKNDATSNLFFDQSIGDQRHTNTIDSHDGACKQRFVPIPVVFMLFVFFFALLRANSVVETNRYSSGDRKDWLDVCRWINENLPREAVVESPTNSWAFKWFAQRAEYVAFKDCPQDAAGIVEWNRRLTFLKKWFDQNYEDQYYSASELTELRQLTGLTHLLTDRLGPLELEPIYRNDTFQVYDLRILK